MRAFLLQVIGRGQVLQLEARRAVVAQRPYDAFRPQGLAHAHEVDQVPAGIAVLPLAPVRLEEISIEQLAGDFVVETQRVVAHATGARLGELLVYARREVGLDHALALGLLGRDAGDQAGLGVRRHLVRWLAEEHHRLADDLQVHARADAGELHRAVAPGVRAEGLVVMPEEGLHARIIACRPWGLHARRRCQDGRRRPRRDGSLPRAARLRVQEGA